MSHPSSRHLSHDFPAFKGLTLRELFVLVVFTTLVTCILSALAGAIIGWPLLSGGAGMILGFVISILVLPNPVSRMKAGKPSGYLMKKTRIMLAGYGLGNSPYLAHTGFWQKARRLGGKHV